MAGRKGEKFWADAVKLAVNRVVETGENAGKKRLAIIAAKVVEMAEDGDMAAIKEIGDRLDGKAPQSLDTEGNITIVLPADAHKV